MKFVALTAVLLGALPARAECVCDAPRVEGHCPAEAHVTCTEADMVELRRELVDAEHMRDVCLAGNAQLARDLTAAQAAASAPSWGTVAQASGVLFVFGVVVGLLLHR